MNVVVREHAVRNGRAHLHHSLQSIMIVALRSDSIFSLDTGMYHLYDTYMNRIRTIERRIEQIKRSLAKMGDMRPGSVSVQGRGWGGEYCQLSYTHRGKGHTEYVRKKKQREIERQIANYRKFRELTKEWVDLGIELCKLKAECLGKK
jgi:hypothetical protein